MAAGESLSTADGWGPPGPPKRESLSRSVSSPESPAKSLSSEALFKAPSFLSEDYERDENSPIRRPSSSSRVNGQEAACVRMFSFRTSSILRDVSVTHTKGVWILYLDGVPLASERHGTWSFLNHQQYSLNFSVDVPGQEAVAGVLRMKWAPSVSSWQYELAVNSTIVPPRWVKHQGPQQIDVPEVVGVQDALALEDVPDASRASNFEQTEEAEPEVMQLGMPPMEMMSSMLEIDPCPPCESDFDAVLEDKEIQLPLLSTSAHCREKECTEAEFDCQFNQRPSRSRASSISPTSPSRSNGLFICCQIEQKTSGTVIKSEPSTPVTPSCSDNLSQKKIGKGNSV